MAITGVPLTSDHGNLPLPNDEKFTHVARVGIVNTVPRVKGSAS